MNNNNKMKIFKLFVCLICFSCVAYGHIETSYKITKSDYIEQWKATAVQNSIQYGVPASITLAQGILESSYGNSALAQEANNHFGIKCHNWSGKTFYQDDDSKHECFRKYANAADSYQDHSVFLKTYSRYAFLFELDKTDYKAWARGLKKAGYATNPQYADLIIRTIEENGLNDLDELSPSNTSPSIDIVADNSDSNSSLIEVNAVRHQVMVHRNKINYLVVKKGDTFYRISKEFDMSLWQLYQYNDFDKHKDVLEIGDIVYLQPKRFHAKGKRKYLICKKNISLIDLSQEEGIRVKSLMRLNQLESENKIFQKGSKVILKR